MNESMSLLGEIGFGIHYCIPRPSSHKTTYISMQSFVELIGGECPIENTTIMNEFWHCIIYFYLSLMVKSNIINSILMSDLCCTNPLPLYEICIASSKVKINIQYATSKLPKSSTSIPSIVFV